MFTPAQLEELLATLTVPVTEIDCGTLCAPDNDGIPICCDKSRIVPVLYKTEYRVLRARSDLWRPFRPQTKDQRELGEDMRSCDKLCECKGVAHCERDNRSLACRTFPLEPYLDHDGELVGLVWNMDFEGTCPLVMSRHKVRQDYIEQAMAMWRKAFEWAPKEQEFYMGHSQTTRRSFGQKRRKVPVFTPDGIRRMPTARTTPAPRR
jgi:hypothetical protein